MRLQVVAPYRTQTYALRRRLVNSTPLDRSRLIGSYIQVAQGFASGLDVCHKLRPRPFVPLGCLGLSSLCKLPLFLGFLHQQAAVSKTAAASTPTRFRDDPAPHRNMTLNFGPLGASGDASMCPQNMCPMGLKLPCGSVWLADTVLTTQQLGS